MTEEEKHKILPEGEYYIERHTVAYPLGDEREFPYYQKKEIFFREIERLGNT